MLTQALHSFHKNQVQIDHRPEVINLSKIKRTVDSLAFINNFPSTAEVGSPKGELSTASFGLRFLLSKNSIKKRK